MLFALLYNEVNEIVAAAPACDQMPIGDSFWRQFHLAGLDAEERGGEQYQTAYVCVTHPKLQRQLQWVGIDETIDSGELTTVVEESLIPEYSTRTRNAA